MKLAYNTDTEKNIHFIATLQRDLNLLSAFLILTGQLTIVGVFVTPGGFSVSFSGPITGGSRLESRFGDQVTNKLIDVIDVIIAVLLIIDELRLVSTIFSQGRFSIDFTGPIFGNPIVEPTLPILQQNSQFIHNYVIENFGIDPLFK